MCLTTISGKNFISTTFSGLANITQGINEVADYNYKAQIALNNAKYAQNEAHNEMQKGIEEARKEKISGLQEASKTNSKNAAGGFDIQSGSNKFNYLDDILISEYNADSTQKEHRQKANSYLSQAQNYYSEARQNKSSTTKFLLSQTSSYLGGLKQELPEYMKGNDVKRWT